MLLSPRGLRLSAEDVVYEPDAESLRIFSPGGTRITKSEVPDLRMRKLWVQEDDEDSPSPVIRKHLRNAYSEKPLLNSGNTMMLQEYYGSLRPLISHPGSKRRLCLDFVGAFLIFYDCLVIPLQAFNPPQHPVLEAMDWTTLIFWTLNMFASPFVGFVKDGVTVMLPPKILLNYVQTWFLVDVLVTVPDWIFTIAMLASPSGSQINAHEAESGRKLLRVLRLVRMVRLLRLLKLRNVQQLLSEMITSEYLQILVNIVQMIVALLVINHAIACLWYLISLQHAGDDKWLVVHEMEDSSWGYQYLTSFHWSITQFTPASMHIQPQNIGERLFAVTTVVFALVGFTYLVGSITGSLTQLRSLREDAAKQFWFLRRYLKQNKVDLVLSLRIREYLEHAWKRQKERLAPKDIKVFSLLSEQLQSELQSELSVPHLIIHPLFKRLSCKAISRKLLAKHDDLFHAGEKATHMFIVISGPPTASAPRSQSLS